MKPHLLLAMALAVALGASATEPAVRVTNSAHGSAKQFNTQGHKSTARPAAARVAAQAPENCVEVPFVHDLGKSGTEVVNYTAINANDDNRKWQFHSVNGYAACMVPNADNIDSNDDWLITVPIHLPVGNYVVSFDVGMMGSGALGVDFDVWLFNAPTLEGKLAEIAPATHHTVKDMTKYEFNCAIPSEGYYYVGVHCTTKKADKGTMKLANLGMREGSVTPPVTVDPPAAGTLSYVLAPQGELRATLTYVAPTKTKTGADLSEISKVELTSRWGTDKFTFENVAPGSTITQEVEMWQGINNRFTATAYVGETAGETVEIKSVFCGKDTPLPPTDVILTVNEGYKSATLSWTAPGAVGENGGYVDTNALTYYIFDAFGTYYDPALFETTDTSITIDYSTLEGQDFFAYQVTAGYNDNYSLDTSSEIIVAGDPEAMPFEESFAGGVYDGVWAISSVTTSGNTHQWGTITDDYFASLFDPEDPEAPTPLSSHDGDKGFYYWLPIESSAVFGLTSIRTDISGASNPVLEFWYQGQGNKIDVLVAGGTGQLAPAHTINLRTAPTNGWTLARIPLDTYKAGGAVMFEVRLSAVDNDDEHTWSIPLDNIRIIDLAATDLHLVNHTLPAKVAPSQALSCTAHIENRGTETATGATAILNINGKAVVSKDVEAIAPNQFADVDFDYTVPLNAPAEMQAAIVLDIANEKTPLDNTASATIEVTRKPFATVTDLNATMSDNNVLLQWSAPVNDNNGPAVINEDFENEEYTPMSISGAGEWTTFDGDGKKTYNVFRELYNPYQTQPMAFQLFNRTIAEVPESYWIDAQAHSGETYMLALSAQSAANDNWLISPELSGNAQTVTFWAKSYTSAWPESMKAYYSTTDNARTSFETEVEIQGDFLADGSVPEVWTQFSIVLPEGAKHFAINHDTYDTLALFIDDVTYEGKSAIPDDLAIEGYHIFRNGEQITDALVTANEYTDTPLADDAPEGNYTFSYTVVPVYNYGPALESNSSEVSMVQTGIDKIEISDLDSDTEVYTLQGMRVNRSQLTPGVYIVVTDGNARRVYLR